MVQIRSAHVTAAACHCAVGLVCKTASKAACRQCARDRNDLTTDYRFVSFASHVDVATSHTLEKSQGVLFVNISLESNGNHARVSGQKGHLW